MLAKGKAEDEKEDGVREGSENNKDKGMIMLGHTAMYILGIAFLLGMFFFGFVLGLALSPC